MSVPHATPVDEQTEALAVARALIGVGIPLFLASPAIEAETGAWLPSGGSGGTGYLFPRGWERTAASPAAVDAWRPGMALCAVTGCGLDVVDVDPRNGGETTAGELQAAGVWPIAYGRAATPSGGWHDFITSLHIGKGKAGPGIDVQAGDPQGSGRGFVFIAPTVKLSKATGQPAAYRWLEVPDLQAWAMQREADRSGAALAELIGATRTTTRAPEESTTYTGPPFAQLPEPLQVAVTRWLEGAIAGVCADLRASADWADGQTDDRGRGWEKLQADGARRLGRLARASWNALTLEDAEELFVSSAPTDVGWTVDDVEGKWRTQHRRGDPAPWPDNLGTSASERDQEAWRNLGVDVADLTKQRAASPGPPEAQAGGEPSSDQAPAATAVRGVDEDRDVGTLADRFLRGRYVWNAGLGWLRYSRGCWSPVSDVHVTDQVRRAVPVFQAEQILAGADDKRIAQLQKYRKLHMISKLAAIARGVLEVEASTLDAHPDLLCVGNGVVDLTTGELRAHDPQLLLTKRTAVDYQPGAVSADWNAALQALPSEVALWLQVRIGQAASGHPTSDDVLPVLQGSGSNGKTTLLGTVVRALGDHAVTVPERVLMANPSDHPTELMTLRGARLALIEETPEGHRLSVKRLKDTLGTPTMTARAIRKDNVTWRATHSLFLTTNYTPGVDESDHGTWRRLALVRFPWTFSADGSDDASPVARPGAVGLRERLFEGRQGQHQAVLSWIVAGAVAWYAADRVMPPAPATVTADTHTWRCDTDLILAYVTERLVLDPDAHVLSAELYEDFSEFVLSRGHRVWAQKTFAARFGDHTVLQGALVAKKLTRRSTGLSRRMTTLPRGESGASYRAWFGVRFRTAADDLADPPEPPNGALTSANADGVTGVTGHSVDPHAGTNNSVNQHTRYSRYTSQGTPA